MVSSVCAASIGPSGVREYPRSLNPAAGDWSSESFRLPLLTPVLLWSISPPGSGCREGTNHRHRPT